jgi:hypothetical protein
LRSGRSETGRGRFLSVPMLGLGQYPELFEIVDAVQYPRFSKAVVLFHFVQVLVLIVTGDTNQASG